MSNERLSEQDVERISSRVASAVVKKIVRYGLIAILALLVLPVTCLYVYRASGP